MDTYIYKISLNKTFINTKIIIQKETYNVSFCIAEKNVYFDDKNQEAEISKILSSQEIRKIKKNVRIYYEAMNKSKIRSILYKKTNNCVYFHTLYKDSTFNQIKKSRDAYYDKWSFPNPKIVKKYGDNKNYFYVFVFNNNKLKINKDFDGIVDLRWIDDKICYYRELVLF